MTVSASKLVCRESERPSKSNKMIWLFTVSALARRGVISQLRKNFKTQRHPIKLGMKSAVCVCHLHQQKPFIISSDDWFSGTALKPEVEIRQAVNAPRALISSRSYFKGPSTSQQPQKKAGLKWDPWCKLHSSRGNSPSSLLFACYCTLKSSYKRLRCA